MSDKKKKSGSLQRGILITLCVVLVIILAVMLFVTIYVEQLFGRMNRHDPAKDYTYSENDLNNIYGNETRPQDLTVPEATYGEAGGPADVIQGDHLVNILLVGQDARPGESVQRSDAMILCTVNKDTKTITFTSFLRDMYVMIPNHWNDKLCHTFFFGGYYGDEWGTTPFQLLDETLTYNFGVKIDGNVCVDFTSFEKVIDLMGGVDIDLTSDESWYLNNSGFYTQEGMNHLDGAAALTYARIRSLDSDFGRTNRQRNVLSALAAKAKGMSLPEMNSVLNEVLPLIYTDMSNSEIVGYALDLFPLLAGADIKAQQIPADGTWYLDWKREMSVITVDFEANQQILKDTLGG